MFYSWHALFILGFIFVGLFTFVRFTNRKEDLFELHFGDFFAILTLLAIYIVYLLFSYHVLGIIKIVSIFITIALFAFSIPLARRFSEKKLIIKHTNFDTPILLFVFIFFLQLACWTSGQVTAKSIIEGKWKDHPLIKFHFNLDENSIPSDSLFLIASSDYYHFVLSPTDTKHAKPKIFAVKKDLISYFEFLAPKK